VRLVGPVLTQGAASDAVIAAICELNRDVEIVDRGAYHRVLVASPCVVTRAAIERHFAASFTLPADLEIIMPSFKGRFSVSEDEARWEES
jgi:hypothetical protein